ncbi:6782_t:CDS:2 [Diversispora eburnea]|uniref:6782_t:CDS:1 n=1 Tax=Diversispora eburnea TaxID=1213867 RepID=A0A9N9FYW7_9GLOM|nr:6782_t:CDS:2 [Diversispora eburnea]
MTETVNNDYLKSNGKNKELDMDLENRHEIQKTFGFVGNLILAYKTIGTIYGDIGTSPLYVFTSIFPDPPTDPRDVYGTLSLIIWSLAIIPFFKYVFIILRADDNGEGGTFALYSLLSRYSGLSIRGGNNDDLTIANFDSMSVHSIKEKPNFIKRSKFVQRALLVLVLFGTSLVLSDGLLTPAISVLSAVEGIVIPAPSLKNATVPISCLIMICLFLVQRTSRLSILFAPIVSLWFISLATIGIWNISHDPSILKAFNPYYAFEYFIRNGSSSYHILGGVLLAITGVEALFADLGHFNRISIQVSFAFFAFPSLTLAYLGQGARLVLDPAVSENTFWLTLPSTDGPIYWIVFILATLATIIASQAMILATFSLVRQAMQLDCLPLLEVNYILLGSILIIIIAFQHSANLTVAYVIVAIVFFLVFGFIDSAFLGSTLLKVQSGGWFTLSIATLLLFVMLIWRWGTTLKVKYELRNKTRLDDIFASNFPEKEAQESNSEDSDQTDEILQTIVRQKSKNIQLQLLGTGFPVNRLPGIGLFYKEAGMGVPLSFCHFIHHFPAVPEILIFITIRPITIPLVGEEDRLIVKKVGNYEKVYQVIGRYGYTENIYQGEEFIKKLIIAICEIDPKAETTLGNLENEVVTYVIGHQKLVAQSNSPWWKRAFLETYSFLVKNSRQIYANWEIPVDKVIEVGMKIAV